jgi:hypothetical protein
VSRADESFVGFDGLGERTQEICCLLCLGRGGEDGSVVVLQQFKPIIDVARVSQLALDARMRTKERCLITAVEYLRPRRGDEAFGLVVALLVVRQFGNVLDGEAVDLLKVEDAI